MGAEWDSELVQLHNQQSALLEILPATLQAGHYSVCVVGNKKSANHGAWTLVTFQELHQGPQTYRAIRGPGPFVTNAMTRTFILRILGVSSRIKAKYCDFPKELRCKKRLLINI